MTIGDRIKSRKIQLGMTQKELALKLGCNKVVQNTAFLC